MSISVSLNEGVLATSTHGFYLKMVSEFLEGEPCFDLCFFQGNNQRTLVFDQESCFSLSDSPDNDGFIVQIKMTRWMRRGVKVVELTDNL